VIGLKSTIAVLLLLAISIGCTRHHDIEILKSGVENWNNWREKDPSLRPNLQGARLDSAHLDSANLWGADLRKAKLQGADLLGANLERANLWGANLRKADLRFAVLKGVNLGRSRLEKADLRFADLEKSDLRGARLDSAMLEGASFEKADLRGARLQGIDPSGAKSFYHTKLDSRISAEIRTRYPEKLATFWNAQKKAWVVNRALLEQIKKPDWHGWTEGKDQGK
jgi:hypothetical protein